jgi:phosphate transport system protein
MGDLALHIAKIARMRYPSSAVPAELRATIREMGQVAERIAGKTGDVIAGKDTALAEELESDDDTMDALHRRLFSILLSDDWAHGMEPAIDITLIGRYYERFADHAVSVARRVIYLVTGEMPQHAVLRTGSTETALGA